ncbi:MAG: WcaI family glycosyltransferase [Candidatus Binataceae bacterium]|nr:WcaI family glycosyltransferase [Candidatus Binataceae bacterium]
MHVLVLGINYWPEETGIGPCTTGLCEYLAGRGHRVTMVTGLPYYPEWRVPRMYRRQLSGRETRNGVTIFRSWLYVPRRVTPRRRILHEASFIGSATMRIFSQLAKNRPDLLCVISPPLGLNLSAIMLSRIWKIPFVTQVEDLQPDAAMDLGMLKAGRLTRMLLKIERTAYDHAALITTLTPGMRARILAKGVPTHKVATIAHSVDPACFAIPLVSDGAAVRRRFGLSGKFLVVHSGNMGVKQGLEVILEAAQRSRRHADLVYLLVGDGAVRESLHQRAAQLGLNNVRFMPVQPREVFHELMATTNVALITQQRTVADIVFPSKTQTLLASGRPVVASVNPGSEVAKAVREANAGLVIAPEDPDALLEAVINLRDDSARRLTMGRKGREYARVHWDRDRLFGLMEERLCDLVGVPLQPAPRDRDVLDETAAERLKA